MGSKRICYECVYLNAANEPDYSPDTPGEGLLFVCTKGHWEIEPREFCKSRLRWALEKAEGCPDFLEEPRRG